MSNLDFFRRPQREFVIQNINGFNITVGTGPTRLTNEDLLSGYIDSILIGVPSAEAQGVFFGDQSVTIASGFPIEVGTSVNLALRNERQLYEVQFTLNGIAEFLKCDTVQPVNIPFVVFDPREIWLVAAAATDLRVMLFPSAYV